MQPPNVESSSEDDFIAVSEQRLSDAPTQSSMDNAVADAFDHLQGILIAKKAAEDNLKGLFKKRRGLALEELEKAKHRLDFVDQEETRMKDMVTGECFKVIDQPQPKDAWGKSGQREDPCANFPRQQRPPLHPVEPVRVSFPRSEVPSLQASPALLEIASHHPSPGPPSKQRPDDWRFETPPEDILKAETKDNAKQEHAEDEIMETWGFEVPSDEEASFAIGIEPDNLAVGDSLENERKSSELMTMRNEESLRLVGEYKLKLIPDQLVLKKLEESIMAEEEAKVKHEARKITEIAEQQTPHIPGQKPKKRMKPKRVSVQLPPSVPSVILCLIYENQKTTIFDQEQVQALRRALYYTTKAEIRVPRSQLQG